MKKIYTIIFMTMAVCLTTLCRDRKERAKREVSPELLADLKSEEYTDFRHENFTQADLRNLNVSGYDFANSNFDSANLDNIDMSKCNLRQANFTGASLRNANLTGADLTQANFTDADLTGAKLDNVIKKQTNFAGALGVAGHKPWYQGLVDFFS